MKTSEGRPAARPGDARPRGGEADEERDTLSAFSWFEMVCFGGAIAIWIGYLTSEFYFTLAVVIVMALAVIALLIEGIKIR